MKTQAITWLYSYGPPTVVQGTSGAPLNATGVVQTGGNGGAPIVVSPPAAIQKPEGGADLTFGYKALVPSVGWITSPDSADLSVNGDMRLTAYVRRDSVAPPGATTFKMLARHVTSVTGWSWLERNDTSNNSQIRVDSTVASVQASNSYWSVVQTTQASPLDANAYVGVSYIETPGASTGTWGGLVSSNGGTWTSLGTFSETRPFLPNDPATDLQIGAGGSLSTGWPGRIYWVQMEAINRARLVFPGVTGNYLSVPDSAALDITGDIEVVVRASQPSWDVQPAGSVFQGFIAKCDGPTGSGRSWIVRRSGTTARQLQFAFSSDGSALITATWTYPAGWADGALVWLRARRVAATGAVSWDYSTDDTAAEPTTWTTGTSGTAATGNLHAGSFPVTIGSDASASRTMTGRVARAIIRNGIAGTTVFDVAENNAGTMATPTTFLARSGQTVTVTQTADQAIVQPQVNRLMWRFDASEYPGTGLSYVDPRGRTWTMTAQDAISDVGSAQFRFPGTDGNYLSVADLSSWADDIEVVARCSFDTINGANYDVIVGNRSGTAIEFLLRRQSGSNRLQLVWTDDVSSTVYQPTATGFAAADAVMAWYRVRLTASTGVVTFEYAADSPTEPTSWTSMGTGTSIAATTRRAVSAPWTIGWDNAGSGGVGSMKGRIKRVIVRRGIGGITVLDVNEANATVMTGAKTFVATAGGTVTETGSVILRT